MYVAVTRRSHRKSIPGFSKNVLSSALIIAFFIESEIASYHTYVLFPSLKILYISFPSLSYMTVLSRK